MCWSFLNALLVKYFAFTTVWIFIVKPHHVQTSKFVYPCEFAETVNITDALRLKDGSYSYEGLLIPAHLTAEYKFKVIDGIEYSAERHIRGCVCRLKPCISFCCPKGFHYDELHQNCTNDLTMPQNAKHAHIEVTYLNGSVDVLNIGEKFVIRYEMGCKNKFVDRKHEQFWKWDFFANGTLLREGQLWSTDEYCFTPLEHKKVWSLTPLNCERFQRGFRIWIYVICTALAIFINLFILFMLISVREVRNSNYGELVIFYIASIIIGFTALIYLVLKNPMNLSHTACRNIGFLAYFFLILSFLLLDFISLDFWYNFRLKRLHGWRRKPIYALIIGLAFGLKFLTKYAQDSNIPRHYKPGIGDWFCWFDMRLWGILIYYYLPIMLCLAFSLFCSAKAYFAMINLPSDTTNVIGCDLKTAKTHFYAYFTYLLCVFCVWTREMIVYISARFREYFFIIDFWTGICILILAITGLICLLYKNMYVQSWWNSNVSNKPNDYEHDVPLRPLNNAGTNKLSEFREVDETEAMSLR